MSEELGIQLHRLYRDYYARRLEFADYRYRRGILLDSLRETYDADATETDDVTKPRARVAEAAAPAELASGPAPEPAPKPAPKPAKPAFTFRWYYVLGACAIVVVAVALLVTRQLGDSDTADAPALAPQPAPVAQPLDQQTVQPEVEEDIVQPPAVGQQLVEEFLARRDWRPLSIVEFQDSWTRLPESARIVAKGAAWFEPMIESLAYEIEEALDFAPDPDDDEQLDHLYELALHLGLVELVPPGWMPDPEEINRGATELAAETAPSDLVVADAPAEAVSEVAENAAPVTPAAEPAAAEAAAAADSAEPEPESESAAGSTASQAGNERACSAAQLTTRRRNCVDVLLGGGNGPPMRVLPAGEFVMGSEAGGGVRTVAIAEPFAMSLFEIRVDDFLRYCGATMSACPENVWGDGDMPVVNIGRDEAAAYAEWLSAETGEIYRLPSEEEWEYAARAGTDTDYPYGDELLPAQARYSSITSYESPLPASDRTTQRNEFGLWHVVGNVREWVVTGTESGGHVARGGSYASGADELRSWAREVLPADNKDRQTGFRLLREL